jgi:Putative transposase
LQESALPQVSGAAAREWLVAREADLLPVGYFHVVFTVPAEIADIAFHNKAEVYDLLFKVAVETMVTIAADPRHLGARIGITAVLHTWGSAMTHHPHIHMIVPGGGISLDGERWVSSRPAFLLPVRVLAKLFRRLFLANLQQLHAIGRLQFFGDHVLRDGRAFLRHLMPLRKKRWVVYSKPPFSGPEAVLAYLSRYTHRVAISNHRLIALDQTGVTFRYKDYRRDGADRQRAMTLSPDEFIRRFLLHVLPKGFHRIRHYGLLASASRKANVARARELLAGPTPTGAKNTAQPPDPRPPCPCCGGRMIIIEIFQCVTQARAPPSSHAFTGTTVS